MQVVGVLFVGLFGCVHLLDRVVEELLEITLLMHLVDVEGQGFGQEGAHRLGDCVEVVREDFSYAELEGLSVEELQVEALDELGQDLEDTSLMILFF